MTQLCCRFSNSCPKTWGETFISVFHGAAEKTGTTSIRLDKVTKGSYHTVTKQKENMVLEVIWNVLPVHCRGKGKMLVLILPFVHGKGTQVHGRMLSDGSKENFLDGCTKALDVLCARSGRLNTQPLGAVSLPFLGACVLVTLQS